MSWKSPWTKGLVVGLGAVLAAPVILPVAAALLRPLAKLVIAGALAASDAVAGLWNQPAPPAAGEPEAGPGEALGTALISEASGAAATPLAEEVVEAAAEILETLA